MRNDLSEAQHSKPGESGLDHKRAVQESFADRYLLQELTPAEAADFESHYFECVECAAAVESGEILIANAREVLIEMPAPKAHRSVLEMLGIRWTWGGMLMPATALALLALAVYQGAVVIPGLRQPRILPAFQLLGTSRGEQDARVVPAGSSAFALTADLPPDVHFPKYACSLETGGRKVLTLDAAPPGPGQPITILVPARGLKSGTYQFTIEGASTNRSSGEQVFSSSFELEFR